MLLEQLQVEQVRNAQAAAAHFVFICRTNSARGGSNLYASRGILRREFDHAMVGKDDVGPVRDEKMAIHPHPRFAQGAHFLQECNGVEDNAITNDTAASGTEHAARHKLKHKFLAVDNDSVAGIVSAGVAGHHGKVLRQHIDDLSLALIAPLGAHDDRSLAFFQFPLRSEDAAGTH